MRFFKAFTNFFRKKISSSVPTDVYMWINYGIFILLLTPITILNGEDVIGMLNNDLFLTFALAALAITAIYLVLEAFKREELSYIAPLNAFIPIFALGFGWALLNEAPPLLGLLGIVAVFIGAYIINIQPDKIKWYDPIVHIFKNAGARFAIASGLAFAANAVLLKEATNIGYSALNITFTTSVAGWVLLAFIPIRKFRLVSKSLKHHRGILLGAAISSMLGVIFGVMAITDTFSSYAVSIRRFDVIFSVILGWHVLKEKNIKYRIIGSILMTLGVAIIAVA